jgi:hypothetical protein
MLIIIALICFAAAAVIGIWLARMYGKGKLSLNAAYLHGLCGAAGLVLLVIAAAKGMVSSFGIAALIIFAAAALGGVVLFVNHLQKGSLPKPLIAVHAVAALFAFLLLLIGAAK